MTAEDVQERVDEIMERAEGRVTFDKDIERDMRSEIARQLRAVEVEAHETGYTLGQEDAADEMARDRNNLTPLARGWVARWQEAGLPGFVLDSDDVDGAGIAVHLSDVDARDILARVTR